MLANKAISSIQTSTLEPVRITDGWQFARDYVVIIYKWVINNPSRNLRLTTSYQLYSQSKLYLSLFDHDWNSLKQNSGCAATVPIDNTNFNNMYTRIALSERINNENNDNRIIPLFKSFADSACFHNILRCLSDLF